MTAYLNREASGYSLKLIGNGKSETVNVKSRKEAIAICRARGAVGANFLTD